MTTATQLQSSKTYPLTGKVALVTGGTRASEPPSATASPTTARTSPRGTGGIMSRPKSL